MHPNVPKNELISSESRARRLDLDRRSGALAEDKRRSIRSLGAREITAQVRESLKHGRKPEKNEVAPATGFSAEHGIEEGASRMAMIVYLKSDDPEELDTSFIKRGVPADNQELDNLYREFQHQQPNQLFVYRHDGQWKVIGQQSARFESQQDKLSGFWKNKVSRT